MASIQREDGTHYGVALAQKRGDSCFTGKTGWYWYDYDDLFGIEDKTVTGPFSDEASALVGGEHRLDNQSRPVHRPDEPKMDPVFSVEDLRTDPNIMAKADCELYIEFDQFGGTGMHEQLAQEAVLLVTAAGVTVSTDWHTLTPWCITDHDANGNMLATVPWEHVRAVFTEAQMAAYLGCRDADERLLSYAH